LPALRKKNKVQPAYNPAMVGMQGQPDPYQQPYQAPGQYDQNNQYNQYPSQPNQYSPPPYNQPYGQAQPGQYDPTQVANPYNQPPQQ